MGLCCPKNQTKDERENLRDTEGLDEGEFLSELQNDSNILLINDKSEKSDEYSKEIPTDLNEIEKELKLKLNKLDSRRRLFIIYQVLTTERRKYQKSIKQLHKFLRKLITTLEVKDQSELKEILLGLPPVVLGQKDGSEARILVNIQKDIKHACTDDRSSRDTVDRISNSISILISKNTWPSLEFLLKSLKSSDRFKLVMSLIISAKILPYKLEDRELAIPSLFKEIKSENIEGNE